MTPSFDKTGKMLAPEQTRKVTRGVSFKLGLPGYSSIDFFSNYSAEVPESQFEEKSEEFYRTAYSDVQRAVEEFKQRSYLTEPPPVEPPSQPVAAKPVEANPFQVSARPPQPSEAPAKEAEVIPPAAVEIVQAGQTAAKETKADPAKELLAEVVSSGLAPVADPPARRGRKAKDTGKDAGVISSSPVEQAAQDASPAVVPEVKSPDKAQIDDSDIPANLGGTHVSEPGPDLKARGKEFIQGQETQIPANGPAPVPSAAPAQAGPQLVPSQDPGERVNAAVARIAAETKKDPEKVKAGAKEFFRAFLNIKGPLPKLTDDVYKFAIPVFESLSFKYAANVSADPASMGLEAGVGWNKLLKHTDRWPEPIKRAALRAAIVKYPDNGAFLLEFLDQTAKLGNLDHELLVFLQVFRVVGPAAAMALRTTAQERGQNMAVIVEGLDLEQITEKDITSRLMGAAPVQAGQPAASGDLWQD